MFIAGTLLCKHFIRLSELLKTLLFSGISFKYSSLLPAITYCCSSSSFCTHPTSSSSFGKGSVPLKRTLQSGRMNCPVSLSQLKPGEILDVRLLISKDLKIPSNCEHVGLLDQKSWLLIISKNF